MSRNNIYHNSDGIYFVSFAVVEWLDVFKRNEYKNILIYEKINYIHNHPVEEGLVSREKDNLYSSAADYAGEKGILDNVIIII